MRSLSSSSSSSSSSMVSILLLVVSVIVALGWNDDIAVVHAFVPQRQRGTGSIQASRQCKTFSLQYIVTSLNEPESYFHAHTSQQHQQYQHQSQYQQAQRGGEYRYSYQTSSPSSSRSAAAAATSYDRELEATLEQNLGEDAIRQHYHEWCAKFHRRQDSFRFMVFQRNYLSQFKWNLAAGKQVFTLNEYADCTEEEYHRIMKQAAKNVVSNGDDNGNLEQQRQQPTMEVTVVLDEDGKVAKTTTSTSSTSSATRSSIPFNAIDVEIVEHNPYLGY